MRALLAAWLIALLSLTSISAVDSSSYLQQGGTTLTVEQYWDLVRTTHAAVVDLQSQPQADVRQQLDSLAAQWDEVNAVQLPDGSVISLHATYLIAQLRDTTPDLQMLKGSLQALLDAHSAFPQEVFTLEDLDPLQKILARPEFQWDQGQAAEMPEWLGKIFEAITEFTARVAFTLAELIYQGRALLMIAAVLLFVFAIFYISRNLSRSLVREAQIAAEGEESEGVLTSKGALQRAQNLSMQGDYRNAVRYLYLSSLLVLDEQGLLRYDRSRTNREYLRSIASRPELANPLRDVIDVFDRVWYGFEDVDEITYKSYVEHVEELREKKE